VLGIENHDRLRATELEFLMETLDSPHVGICLDCVNSLGAGEGLDHVAKHLSPYTVNLHIKDFTIQRAVHSMGFTVTGAPAGKGMTNIPALLETLGHFQRCQSAVLEQWVPFQGDLTRTIKLEERWAEESLSYLKAIPLFGFQPQTAQSV
jgi:3-oxoisoapionate decarboxylase